MIKRNKIGIFDSGVGGLTLVKHLFSYLPGYDLLYFGDTARVPYGSKSEKTITKFALEDTEFLLSQGARIVIIGCNTVSAVAYDVLQDNFSVPILDIIFPGVKEALRKTTNGKIGIIGTQATVNSKSHEYYLNRLEPSVKVFSNPCPLLAPLAENNNMSKYVVKSILKTYLQPLVKNNIDTLILGCTHYPYFISEIENLYPNLNLIDPAKQAAQDLKKLLQRDKNLDSQLSKNNHTEYFVSDTPKNFVEVYHRFIDRSLEHVKVVDLEKVLQPKRQELYHDNSIVKIEV